MAPKDQNFTHDNVDWNIRLEDSGHLSFKADGHNGNGDARMVIERSSGVVAIGGSGKFGRVRLTSDGNVQTAFIGHAQGECVARLGGDGLPGRIQLFDRFDRPAVDLDGDQGVLILGIEGEDGNLLIQDNNGKNAMRADGQERRLTLSNSAEEVTASLRGDLGRLELFTETGHKRVSLEGDPVGSLNLFDKDAGRSVALRGDDGTLTLGADVDENDPAAIGLSGHLLLRNDAGVDSITCDGDTGLIECVTLTERPIPLSAERSIGPLVNALDRVLALRGVRYQRNQVITSMATVDDDGPQIGFVCQELEAICPELIATDTKGRKSVNYSRMTAVLVEAVKEQQQQIREQAAALEAISERLGLLSVADQGAGRPK